MFGKRSPNGATTPTLPTPTPSVPATPGKTKVNKEKSEQFNALKMRLHRKLIDQLDLARMVGDDETLRAQVKEMVGRLADQENTLLNYNERQRLVSEVLDETFGLGPLEVLLSDPTISDILVNGPKQVYVERRGQLEITGIEFRDNAHLMHIIDKIVSAVGRRCDETVWLTASVGTRSFPRWRLTDRVFRSGASAPIR